MTDQTTEPFAYTCTDGAHRLTITPDPDARDYYGDIRPIVEVAITDVTDDDAEPAVVSVWGPDAGTVATAIRTAGRVSLGETEPQATAEEADDDALIQALSDAGAICGDCGSEPGDRYCEHCERARRWYVDAARRAGWLPRTEADHPLDDMTPQTCPAGLHADWAVDSESTHTCPWCENERLLARVAELEARPDRATVLRDAADALDNSDRLRDLTDDHMSDVNAAANELRRMAAIDSHDAAHTDEREPAEPVELRWRPQDVLLCDDDGAELLLTTSDGHPAILRLDGDQRRALRDDLADEDEDTVTFTQWGVRTPEGGLIAPPYDDREDAEGYLAYAHHVGQAAELVTRTATYTDWQPVTDEDGDLP